MKSLFLSTFWVMTLLFNALAYADMFTQITSGEIVNDGGNSQGASCIDIDDDGDMDVYVTNVFQSHNFFYKNNGDCTFTKMDNAAIETYYRDSNCPTWADYDNDNDPDLFIANAAGSNILYRNEGNWTFTEIADTLLAGGAATSLGASWADYNNDGNVDLFVVNGYSTAKNFLYQNTGSGNFVKIVTGDIVNEIFDSRGCNWADIDNDNDLDIFITNHYSDRNCLLRNDNFDFTPILNTPATVGGEYSVEGNWADIDNDCDFDLFITTGDGSENLLFINDGTGNFSQIFTGALVTDDNHSMGSSWGDFDNNGWLDVFIANTQGTSNALYLNCGDCVFEKVESDTLFNDFAHSIAAVNFDFNNDGFLDIFVANHWSEDNFLFQNAGNENNWIILNCKGTESNASAIGAKIKVKATINNLPVWQLRQVSSHTGQRGQNSPRVHFGLEQASVIDSLVIQWPSGIVQVLKNIDVNQILNIEESSNSTDFCLSFKKQAIIPGDTFTVPLYASFPTDSSFYSAELSFSGFQDDLEFLEIQTDSSMLRDANFSIEMNAQDSILTVALAGASSLYSEGILFWLKFYAPDSVSGNIQLTISSALFNTSAIPDTLKDGDLWVPPFGDVDLNGIVQSYDASVLLRYLCDENEISQVQQHFANVSSDTTLSAFDASLILQYIVGLQDDLPLDENLEKYQAEGSIHWDDLNLNAENFIALPLQVEGGSNIYSFEGIIEYDENDLEFVAIECNADLITDSGVRDGKIYFSGCDDTALPKDAIIGDVSFRIKASCPDSGTCIILKSLKWNEGETIKNVTDCYLDISTNVADESKMIGSFSLKQNYPNPFNPVTEIHFQIPESEWVTIEIYNVMGEKISTLLNKGMSSGKHKIVFNAADLSSGIYFYTIKAGKNIESKKCLLMK